MVRGSFLCSLRLAVWALAVVGTATLAIATLTSALRHGDSLEGSMDLPDNSGRLIVFHTLRRFS